MGVPNWLHPKFALIYECPKLLICGCPKLASLIYGCPKLAAPNWRSLGRCKVVGGFNGDGISSDEGGLLLREVEQRVFGLAPGNELYL